MSRKSPVKCFRCQQTYKGSSVSWRSYGTNCDLLLHSVWQDGARAGVQTEPSIVMDESLSAYCGPTMTVFSSRTLGRMILATLLPDLTYWHREAQCVSQAGVWEWHPVIPLKVCPPPRPLLCTGDFKIKEAIHHLQHVLLRPSGEMKGE